MNKLPNEIIFRILNERMIMKRNDRYKNNFNNCINQLNNFYNSYENEEEYLYGLNYNWTMTKLLEFTDDKTDKQLERLLQNYSRIWALESN
tara:strand:- start:109 stop:381 length:273 start_codon:yes stop_codon:yes gene_type:complete